MSHSDPLPVVTDIMTMMDHFRSPLTLLSLSPLTESLTRRQLQNAFLTIASNNRPFVCLSMPDCMRVTRGADCFLASLRVARKTGNYNLVAHILFPHTRVYLFVSFVPALESILALESARQGRRRGRASLSMGSFKGLQRILLSSAIVTNENRKLEMAIKI